MIQLPLSNWTANSSSITSMARSQGLGVLLGGRPHSSVLRGFAKQRSAMLENIDTTVVGGMSWNTGPETSI